MTSPAGPPACSLQASVAHPESWRVSSPRVPHKPAHQFNKGRGRSLVIDLHSFKKNALPSRAKKAGATQSKRECAWQRDRPHSPCRGKAPGKEKQNATSAYERSGCKASHAAHTDLFCTPFEVLGSGLQKDKPHKDGCSSFFLDESPSRAGLFKSLGQPTQKRGCGTSQGPIVFIGGGLGVGDVKSELRRKAGVKTVVQNTLQTSYINCEAGKKKLKKFYQF